MSSFLDHPVDIPCRSFVNLKSNKSSTKLIEFLNQSSLVLLNGRKIGDTSSKLICRSTVDTLTLYLGTCIIRYNTLTQVGFQANFQLKCLRS